MTSWGAVSGPQLSIAVDNGRTWKLKNGGIDFRQPFAWRITRADDGTLYLVIARRAEFAFLKAQYLSDAGRCWTAAGDTTKALADYRTIVSGMDSTLAIPEAKVRIGELTRGAGVK